jgi:hypothetical protein
VGNEPRAWGLAVNLNRGPPFSDPKRPFADGTECRLNRSRAMAHDQVYDEPSKVHAEDGAVTMDGPDAIDVKLTPEAAEKTSDGLAEEAVRARGQRRLRNIAHTPR